jgi:hypothetical protein
LLRLISCVAIVGLLGSSLSAETVIFSDDFESGTLAQWTIVTGNTTFDISTAQNRIPVGGSYSALMNISTDRMYHNLGSEASGHLRFTSYLYDDTQTRAFTEMRAYSGAGYGAGTLQQLLAIGRYSSVTMAGETYDATKYQGRVLYPSATMGWFNLNASGAPSRSTGWHRFDIEVMPSGTDLNFYVDGVLSRANTGATAATYDSVVMGSVGAGSTAGNAWVDGIALAIVPEPGSIALVASGLAALAGLALSRARRRSA